MYDNLPQNLKSCGAFCLWQYEKDRTGRMTKVPYKISGVKASSTDSSTFTTFAEAVDHMDGYSGIGLGVFDDLAAIDIDHCVVDGALSEMAQDVIGIMDSYTEYSTSGTGVRILFRVRNVSYDKDFEPLELRRQLENGLPAAASGEKLQVSDVLVILPYY